MTVLHLISSGGYYGAESMILTLIRSLRVLGIESVLAGFRNAQNPHVELIEAAARENIRTEVISCGGRIDFTAVRTIRNCLARHGAHVVHTHGYKADIYGYLASRGGLRPIAATCHNWTNDTRWVRLYGRCDRWLLRRFRAVTAVSCSVGTTLQRAGIGSDNIRVIPNGIDVDRFASPSRFAWPSVRPGALVVGTAGRLVPQKGLLDLVAVAPAVLARVPNTQFLIAGEGPQRAELENAAREAGVADAFIFTGAISDMPRLYSAMDIFVLPSLNEGMPMTVLEAMAAGLPVAASRVGAIPEMVPDGEAGRLFAAGDRIALTAALIDLLSASEARTRMGNAGRTRAHREYSSLAMARRYMQLYNDLVGGTRAA